MWRTAKSASIMKAESGGANGRSVIGRGIIEDGVPEEGMVEGGSERR